jgi:hypothetical protein
LEAKELEPARRPPPIGQSPHDDGRIALGRQVKLRVTQPPNIEVHRVGRQPLEHVPELAFGLQRHYHGRDPLNNHRSSGCSSVALVGFDDPLAGFKLAENGIHMSR